jgi:hypothetical protein
MDTPAVAVVSSTFADPPAGPGTEPYRFRAFGVALADLDLDLEPGCRPTPHLVTDVLAACLLSSVGDGPDRTTLWRMPVGKRIEALLRIIRLEQPSEIPVKLRCANAACAELIEVGLKIEELLESAGAEELAELAVEVGGHVRTIRKPTGLDQLAWLEASFEDDATAERAMAEELLITPVESEPTDDVVAAVDDALDLHDVLGAFRLSVFCPYCDELFPHELDLAALLLGLIRHAQARLVEEIHAIARAYHWTEGEILSIPPRRRARYISLLNGEARE